MKRMLDRTGIPVYAVYMAKPESAMAFGSLLGDFAPFVLCNVAGDAAIPLKTVGFGIQLAEN
jgi:hypothetical protein